MVDSKRYGVTNVFEIGMECWLSELKGIREGMGTRGKSRRTEVRTLVSIWFVLLLSLLLISRVVLQPVTKGWTCSILSASKRQETGARNMDPAKWRKRRGCDVQR